MQNLFSFIFAFWAAIGLIAIGAIDSGSLASASSISGFLGKADPTLLNLLRGHVSEETWLGIKAAQGTHLFYGSGGRSVALLHSVDNNSSLAVTTFSLKTDATDKVSFYQSDFKLPGQASDVEAYHDLEVMQNDFVADQGLETASSVSLRYLYQHEGQERLRKFLFTPRETFGSVLRECTREEIRNLDTSLEVIFSPNIYGRSQRRSLHLRLNRHSEKVLSLDLDFKELPAYIGEDHQLLRVIPGEDFASVKMISVSKDSGSESLHISEDSFEVISVDGSLQLRRTKDSRSLGALEASEYLASFDKLQALKNNIIDDPQSINGSIKGPSNSIGD